jgi:hypothetical protein
MVKKKKKKAVGRRNRRAAASKPRKRKIAARSSRRPAKKARAKKPSRKIAALRPPVTRRTDRADRRGLGLEAGGQSGDLEGLSRAEVADSESVEELAEEGQAFEAGIVDGVENAPDAEKGPIRTREVPEDDVPEEYLDKD